MAKGTVRWFNPTKGYGFIIPETDGTKDVFVHISQVEKAGLRTLQENQSIEYDEQRLPEGKTRAINLRLDE
jgi:CspA family cold shock protein